MAVMPKCPSCGLESTEIRCPRCNTLKVIGCSGSCLTCKTAKGCSVPPEDREAAECESPESRER